MPVSDYTPDVDAVAAFIRARTKTRGGAEAGTFNPANAADQDKTRPTEEGVTELINSSVDDISSTLGEDIDERYFKPASRVAALRAALLVELNYFPEQIVGGRSPYDRLKDLLDETWENLLTSMGISTDEGGGAVSVDAGFPSYGGFPTTAIGMEHPW